MIGHVARRSARLLQCRQWLSTTAPERSLSIRNIAVQNRIIDKSVPTTTETRTFLYSVPHASTSPTHNQLKSFSSSLRSWSDRDGYFTGVKTRILMISAMTSTWKQLRRYYSVDVAKESDVLKPSGYNTTSGSGTTSMHCVPRVSDSQLDPSTLSATTVVRATLNPSGRLVDVSWNDGSNSSYPYCWLRDCCQCAECFNEPTESRQLLFHQIDITAVPVNLKVVSETQELVVTWSDGHVSPFRYKWLLARSFRPTEQATRAKWNGRRTQQLWGSEFIERMPVVIFDELMNDEMIQYEWITMLEEIGFVLIKDVPLEIGQIEKLAQHVAYIRKTNFGDISTVRAKSNPSNIAFTSGPLMLHTDLAYYNSVPGMQMMHCIEQASGKGGESLFVDGFHVVKQLQEENPEHYRILTTTMLDFYNTGRDFVDFHQMSRHPTISLDSEGALQRIAYSSHSRDSFMRLPVNDVEPFYLALKAFTNLLYDPSNTVPYKMKPGDMTCFNNWRVLHGREGFDLDAGTGRLLEHGYIDWDELQSKRRVLKTRLNISDEDY